MKNNLHLKTFFSIFAVHFINEEYDMAKLIIQGKEFEVDGDGFLQQPEIWNEDIAMLFALEDGTGFLNEKHWAVIRFIRSYWQENNMAPMVRKVCQESGLKLRDIYELFPLGPAKGACKIAGLPKPDGCV
jgi:tRNA 2-thiouridine synthesizing protein E